MGRVWALLALVLAGPATAADLAGSAGAGGLGAEVPLRDFEGRIRRSGIVAGCAAPPPRNAGAPATITNAPWDPTYVGSAYGLGRPSRDGLVPGPGYDDPYDRGLRRCR